jgi:DNA-binding CsgD family transcriptional regulator/transcriptional regulator with GAF, ATPase, and Fis domain
MQHLGMDNQPAKSIFGEKVKIWSDNVSASEFYDWEEQMRLLSDMGDLITSDLSLEEVIAVIYASVNKLMDAYQFGVGLYDEADDTILYKGLIENSRQLPEVVIDARVPNRLARWCIQNDKEIFINDIDLEYSRYVTNIPRPVAGISPKAALYVPLKMDGKVMGVIVVRAPHKNVYQKHHLYILKTLGNFVIKTLALVREKNKSSANSETIQRNWHWAIGSQLPFKAKKILSLLTDREKDVLILLVSGLSNKAIAEKLFVSPGTIKTHTLNIYKKLEVGNRTSAIMKAIELNLLI